MALHLLATLNLSTLRACVACLGPMDELLLLGDGVYHLSSDQSMQQLLDVSAHILALQEDFALRLPGRVAKVPLIDYTQWVDLCITSGPTVSWY
jgi:sulfur relay protein TusB/DsrH